ncbi:maleylpyruvate isomerase family mycothiol-dependent enzyme [Streptomyces sp. NPDC097619]|uniref:maleylpyruvate isomerase family mycothiol-dependent enzyme n=1 Tax=Streptomyces sp. NPDC097619 TaxID=3157228 RepID=UPI0033299901
MGTTDYVKIVELEGAALAEAAERAGTEAAVPNCPGWRVTDLLRHTGSVHRWAARHVGEGLLEPGPFVEAPDLAGGELLTWFRDGHRALVDTLASAPADRECWTFLPTAPASPVEFWARRQAHENTVHRLDAESALGGAVGPVAAALAEDGVDELLRGFHARPRSRVRTPDGAPKVLRVRAADTGAVWSVHLSAEPPRTVRDASGPADCEATGTAEWLYAALWNRVPLAGPGVTGDLALARLWQDTSPI